MQCHYAKDLTAKAKACPLSPGQGLKFFLKDTLRTRTITLGQCVNVEGYFLLK